MWDNSLYQMAMDSFWRWSFLSLSIPHPSPLVPPNSSGNFCKEFPLVTQQALALCVHGSDSHFVPQKKSRCTLLKSDEEMSLLANEFCFPATAKSTRGEEFGKKSAFFLTNPPGIGSWGLRRREIESPVQLTASFIQIRAGEGLDVWSTASLVLEPTLEKAPFLCLLVSSSIPRW